MPIFSQSLRPAGTSHVATLVAEAVRAKTAISHKDVQVVVSQIARGIRQMDIAAHHHAVAIGQALADPTR